MATTSADLKTKTYLRAVSLLTGFLQTLDDVEFRSAVVASIDLSRLDETDPESMACEILDELLDD